MRFLILSLLIFVCSCTQAPDSEKEKTDAELLIEQNEATLDENDAKIDSLAKVIIEREEVADTEPYVSEEYVDLDWEEYEESMTMDFSYVIIISTKSYSAALERAKEASEKMGYPLDLRGLEPNSEMGLSLPEEVCGSLCGDDEIVFPQYLPRSSWGDTKYVSVEYSDSFDGFTKGYFIVIVASGEAGDPIVDEAVKDAQKFYKDAYAKTCGVWMGCGC
jgi:hypothetical protein